MMPAAQLQPSTQQPQLPAAHQTFQHPSPYVQLNNTFSTPMWKQPPPHSLVQHAPPNQQHSMMHQPFLQQLHQHNFQPSQQRLEQLEQRLEKMEKNNVSTQQHILHQMTENHNMLIKLIQQKECQPSPNVPPPAHATHQEQDLMNFKPVEPKSHQKSPVPSATPQFNLTPNVVDLTNDTNNEVASCVTNDDYIPQPTTPAPATLAPNLHPYISTPTPQLQQSYATSTINQQPIIVKVEGGKKDKRLNFTKFRSNKDDYETWKASCFVKINTAKEVYPSATMQTTLGTITLNPYMEPDESQLIVQQTIDSLDEPSHFTTGVEILSIKAFSLWQTLDAFYGTHGAQRDEDDDDYSAIIAEWANFSREPNESLEKYTLRYRKLVKKLKSNQIFLFRLLITTKSKHTCVK